MRKPGWWQGFMAGGVAVALLRDTRVGALTPCVEASATTELEANTYSMARDAASRSSTVTSLVREPRRLAPHGLPIFGTRRGGGRGTCGGECGDAGERFARKVRATEKRVLELHASGAFASDLRCTQREVTEDGHPDLTPGRAGPAPPVAICTDR